MEKIKIAFIHGALDCRGGAERKLLLLAQYLRSKSDIELTIYTLHYDKEKTFIEYLEGLTVVEVARPGLMGRLKALWEIGRLTRDADLIHAHNHPAHMAAVFSKLRKRKPIIWFQNEPALYVDGNKERTPLLKLLALRALELLLVPCIDIVVANSKNTQDNIKKAIHRQSAVIYSGVDTSLLQPLPEKPEARQIFLISRLEKEKNIGFFLELAKEFPQYQFVLAGNGAEEAALRERIATEKITNMELRINIPEAEKIALYQHSDVFVFPTMHEPLGINVVEALSCGVPVIAFNSGGPRETIVNGETGYLVDNEDEFKRRLKELMENREQRDLMGLAARQRVIENFSLEQMIRKTIEWYNKLLRQYRAKEVTPYGQEGNS